MSMTNMTGRLDRMISAVVSVCVRVCADLGDQLQVVDVVLLGDDQLVDVALPLSLHGTQHVQQVEVSAPCSTKVTHSSNTIKTYSTKYHQRHTYLSSHSITNIGPQKTASLAVCLQTAAKTVGFKPPTKCLMSPKLGTKG